MQHGGDGLFSTSLHASFERTLRMTWQDPALAQRYVWPGDDLTVIPDWVYTDETIYAREVERIFHGPTWNYVALEAEVAKPGDYIRSHVGPTPVVVARAEDGSISVVENRCMHRAAEFCRELNSCATAIWIRMRANWCTKVGIVCRYRSTRPL